MSSPSPRPGEPVRDGRLIGEGALLALGVNGIVGVGIFFAPAQVAREVPGLAGTLVYPAAAFALLPVALAFARLGAAFPVDGGPAVWAERAAGPRAAFLVGWMAWVSSLFSLAAVVTGLSHHAGPLVGATTALEEKLLGVALVVGLGALAALGLRPSARVWSAVTVLKLLPLLALVALGVGLLGAGQASVAAPRPPVAFGSIERASLVVLFALQGFEVVPVLAGCVRDPVRAVPRATLGALGLAVVLYSALHAIAAASVPALGEADAPLVAAARALGGASAEALVSVGANLSALGIAFGMANTTPRYLVAIAGAPGRGAPLAQIDDRGVPRGALGLSLAAALCLVVLSERLDSLFALSSLAVLAQYSASVLALAVLALRGDHGLPRRAALLAPLSSVGVFLVARGATTGELGVAAGVLGAGFVVERGVAAKARRR